jgi:hypothetical protein
MKTMKIGAALFCGLYSMAGFTQPGPPGPPGVPPAEVFATIPDLSAAQQTEVRKILLQRRDAQDAVHSRTRTEMEALHTKERNEHERIDEQTTDQLRKALGDEGYRHYAQWQVSQHGPHEDGPRPPHRGPDGGHPPTMGAGPGGAAGAAPNDE